MRVLALILLLFVLHVPFWGEGLGFLNLNNNDQLIIAQANKRSPTSQKKRSNLSNKLLKIDVRGTYYTTKSDVVEQLLIQKGDSVNNIKIKRSKSKVKSLGVYESVELKLSSYKGGKKLLVNVKENPLIGDIQINGNTIFVDDDIRAVLKSKPNQIFNINHFRQDINTINEFYQDAGYVQAKVYQLDTPKADREALIFNISEGIIDAVTITGNTKTRDYVILREMLTKPGMVVKNEMIREDIRRIFNLNYFQGIEPYFPESTTTPNHYTLDLHITERDSNAQFSFGGGYSPRAGFSFFTDLYWDNFLGTGQLIALKGQFGRSNTYQFKYYNPWMWDDRKSFTFKTWVRDGEVEAYNPLDMSRGFAGEESKGVEVGVGWPHSYELRSSHFYKFEFVNLTDLGRKYYISSYTFGLSYDTRDIRYMPLNGKYYTLYVEQGFDFGGRALEFTKFDIKIQNYFQTFDSQTIATRLTFGDLNSPQISDEGLFSREIYYLGGSNSIRGYEEWPPISQGTNMALATLEYRFYFNDMFQLVIFTDAGFATYGENLWSLSNYTMGKGVGARIRTPLGPLRLDFGIDEEGVGRLHFNIGHDF